MRVKVIFILDWVHHAIQIGLPNVVHRLVVDFVWKLVIFADFVNSLQVGCDVLSFLVYHVKHTRHLDNLFIGSRDDREDNHANELDDDHVVHLVRGLGAVVAIPNRASRGCNEVKRSNINISCVQRRIQLRYPIIISPQNSITFHPPHNLIRGPIRIITSTSPQIIRWIALPQNDPNARHHMKHQHELQDCDQHESDVVRIVFFKNAA